MGLFDSINAFVSETAKTASSVVGLQAQYEQLRAQRAAAEAGRIAAEAQVMAQRAAASQSVMLTGDTAKAAVADNQTTSRTVLIAGGLAALFLVSWLVMRK